MKTLKEFESVAEGTVVAWLVYYRDDDTLCCVLHCPHKAEAYAAMAYTVKPLRK